MVIPSTYIPSLFAYYAQNENIFCGCVGEGGQLEVTSNVDARLKRRGIKEEMKRGF